MTAFFIIAGTVALTPLGVCGLLKPEAMAARLLLRGANANRVRLLAGILLTAGILMTIVLALGVWGLLLIINDPRD